MTILTDKLAGALRTIITSLSPGLPLNHKCRGGIKAGQEYLVEYDKQNPNHSAYLKALPLPQALWWFIENVGEDTPHRNDYFFLLRERVRNESPSGFR